MPLFNDVPTQQIITSATQPSNSIQGLIWNELDSDNNLIETWLRNSNRWESKLKDWRFHSDSTLIGTLNYSFLPDTRFNLFFNKWTGIFWNQGVISGSGRHAFQLAQGVNATYTGAFLKERASASSRH